MTLPAIELTQEDLAKRWGEEDSEFLPAMLSCRERQLEAEMLEVTRLRNILACVCAAALVAQENAIQEAAQ